jgi:2-aminoadipate transaminase
MYFYVIPDFQNPSGAVMGMGERQALTAMAKKNGFMIIEDNPYRKLRYEGSALPTLFEMSPDEVIHMSSYSKQISPGMRIGYMILPKTTAGAVIQFAEDTYVCPSFFSQAVVAEFIERGMLEKNLQNLIKLYRPRLRTIIEAMETRLEEYGEWITPQGGFYVGLTLEEKIDMDKFRQAASAGLALTNGRGFYIDGGNHFIRLPFCPLTEEENAEGIRRIADAAKASL